MGGKKKKNRHTRHSDDLLADVNSIPQTFYLFFILYFPNCSAQLDELSTVYIGYLSGGVGKGESRFSRIL
jgi:hypothetical protein